MQLIPFLAAALLAAPAAAGELLSSHREAPAITETPKVDGTDFYFFRSYETGQEDMLVLVANFLPLQDPYGGPNYFTLDPDARYEIHVDNDGDAVEDVTFRFAFDSLLRDVALSIGDPGEEKTVSVPLVNVGPFADNADADVNVLETFTLDVVTTSGKKEVVQPVLDTATQAAVFDKPLDNIGAKSIPDYAAYAAQFVHDVTLPGGAAGRVFVGQRKDPFVVNLGETFDLVNLNPLGPEDGNADDLADANVTSLILEVPISFLVAENPVLGAWSTASLPRTRVLQKNTDKISFEEPDLQKGRFVQVSRLGSPLVNELVIGLKDKDRFNASQPADDAQFLDYVTHPTLPAILEALFGVTAPRLFPRSDLVQAFVTGVPGLNENGGTGEMLRLNTSIAPVAAAQQSRLGVLGGDTAGFPNGRRPGDDVVDIELRVAMGVLLPLVDAPDGQLAYTDGASVDAGFFGDAFPFLADPLPGSPQD
jgi:hypothetical protein